MTLLIIIFGLAVFVAGAAIAVCPTLKLMNPDPLNPMTPMEERRTIRRADLGFVVAIVGVMIACIAAVLR